MKTLLQSPLRIVEWLHLLSHFFTMSDEINQTEGVETAGGEGGGTPEPQTEQGEQGGSPEKEVPVAVEPEAPLEV